MHEVHRFIDHITVQYQWATFYPIYPKFQDKWNIYTIAKKAFFIINGRFLSSGFEAACWKTGDSLDENTVIFCNIIVCKHLSHYYFECNFIFIAPQLIINHLNSQGHTSQSILASVVDVTNQVRQKGFGIKKQRLALFVPKRTQDLASNT